MDKLTIDEIVAGMQKHLRKNDSSKVIQVAKRKSATDLLSFPTNVVVVPDVDKITSEQTPSAKMHTMVKQSIPSEPMTTINFRFESNESEFLNDRTPSSETTAERSTMWQPGTKIQAIENCHVTANNASVSNKACSDPQPVQIIPECT